MRFIRRLLGPKKKNETRKRVVDVERIDRYVRHAEGKDAYLSAYFEAMRNTGSNDNIFKQNRFFTLYQMVSRVLAQGPSGDIAECGCWRGHSTYLLANLLKAGNWPGHFWVFDSFEGGLSDKTPEDRTGRGNTSPEATRNQKESFFSDYDAVKASLAPFPFVSLHKGWIPASFDAPGLAESRFALVHIDVDLYEPTRDSLEFFYPRMNPGGIIVIDDYGSALFPGSKTAVDEYLAKVRPAFFLESHLMGAVIVV
ncbi:TylF/MycF/NovP-related O-methyltransferase [Mesorhizobium yinganensis]|uniref:TylF/MycF/NovP-related O-methyltransferase n=1 Tax=Mesorhizobium yinganensis TaxID=3157707 RepID=UPI0032B6FA03